MRNLLLILILVVFISVSCRDSAPNVPVGLETDILATETDVLDFNDYPDYIFDSVIRLHGASHFQGKALSLFDTVYTSVVDDLDPIAVIKIIKHGDFSILAMNENNGYAMLLKRNGVFVYREIVHETIEEQSILIDVTGRDSALIAKYFNERKLSEIINP